MTKCKGTEGEVKLQSWIMDDGNSNNSYKIQKEENCTEENCKAKLPQTKDLQSAENLNFLNF